MIGVDTNVIIRYILQDHLEQSNCANKIIEKSIANKETLAISQTTLCEIVWVLESCYNSSKKEIIDVLKQLLTIPQICLEGDVSVRKAVRDFEQHKSIDFSDCLIGRQNAFNGCSFTYTFDKKASKKLSEIFKLAK